MKQITCILIAIFLLSCTDQIEDNPIKDSSPVLQTFTQKLPLSVDSIQTISQNHPVFLRVLESEEFKNSLLASKSLSSEKCIYYYPNNVAALLVCDENETDVFSYVYNTKTLSVIDVYIANFSNNYLRSTLPVDIKVKSLISGEILFDTQSESELRRSWGECMDDAIDELYDDWKNSPGGTFACWVTGPLCVIGGGIACVIE